MASSGDDNVMDAVKNDAAETRTALSRKEFNRNRKIVVRNVPGITVEEVKEFLGDYKAKNILISKKFKHAVVTLKDEDASDAAIAALNGKTFHDCKVEVKYNPCNRLLCVGNLPANIKDADFRDLVQSYGPVERCFLNGFDTGAGKQYGFVEFSKTLDEVKEIRHQLNGKTLQSGTVIACDLMSASIVDFEQLFASCLCVKNLPMDFTDDELLLKEFSVIAKPLFCRVARKDDEPVGFAIVEFADGATAQRTCSKLKNLTIRGRQVELEMCVPGQTVPEAFTRQMSLLETTVKRRSRIKRSLPSKLYNVRCKTPTLDPKLYAVLKENSALLLNSFKKLLLRLEQCRMYEQQQTMSDEPGLLGEAPATKPSLYSQLNVQCAILSVYLAALAQQPDCNMQGLMYNPMIMQASCTVYSLVAFCNGENEADLQPVLFPLSSPLVSEDFDADVLMAMSQGGKAASLGMLGSLPGGIATLVDVVQLLATMQKVLTSQTTAAGNDKCESADADGDGIVSSLLGPPPLMSSKPPSIQALSRLYQFAFNHVLASHIQAQLLQRLTVPVCDEPVPPEARIPISSLGGVVSLFDLPLVRPLVAKSSLKTATELSTASQSAAQQTSTPLTPVATTNDSILGRAPGPRFPGPPKNSAVPTAPGVRPGPPQGLAVRPFSGRNFASAGNWPRPRGDVRPVMTSQTGERNQWTGGWMDRGNSKPEGNWHWVNNETAGNVYEGQAWNSGPQPIQPDRTSYSGPPRMKGPMSGSNVAKRPHIPPASQSARPNLRGKSSQATRPWSNRSSGQAGPGTGTLPASTPSSGSWPQYPKDPSGWSANQPDAYSSYPSGTGEWYDSSSAVPWAQSSNTALTSQAAAGTFAVPPPPSQTTPSAYQQQNFVPGPTMAGMSNTGDGAAPVQPGVAGGNAYGWNGNASASQWQTPSQWPWPQDNNQWQQSAQPFQFMVG